MQYFAIRKQVVHTLVMFGLFLGLSGLAQSAHAHHRDYYGHGGYHHYKKYKYPSYYRNQRQHRGQRYNHHRHYNRYQRNHYNRYYNRGYQRRYERRYHRGYGYRHRGFRDAAYIAGGVVAGSLLIDALTTPRQQADVPVTRRSETRPSRNSRHLFRDRNGRCFERSRGADDTEIGVEIDPSQCDW